jgi:ferredoxin-NADP reductase
VIFKDELERIAEVRQTRLHFLIGPRREDRATDPFAPKNMRQLVPDVKKRDVFICGPPAMMESVTDALASMGVPRSQLHYERFALL